MKNKNHKKSKENSAEKYLQVADNTTIRTLINTLPYVGGALDTLIFHKAGKIKEKRLKNFLRELKKDLEKLSKNAVNKKFLESEEFFYITEQIIIQVLDEQDKSKLELYRKLFRKSFTSLPHDYEYRDYLQTIKLLTPSQLMVFKYFIKHKNQQIVKGKLYQRLKLDCDSIFDVLTGLGLLRNTIETTVDGDDADTETGYQLSKYGENFAKFLELEFRGKK